MQQLAFDIVIVGAGPSAAGLLRGLLLRILDQNNHRHEDGNNQSKRTDNNIQIVVLERGAGDTSPGVCNDNNISANAGIGSSSTKDDHRNTEEKIDEPSNIATSCESQRQNATTTKSMTHHDRFSHSHPSTSSLQNWFTAAHYTSKPTKYIIQQGNAHNIISSSSSSSHPNSIQSDDDDEPTFSDSQLLNSTRSESNDRPMPTTTTTTTTMSSLSSPTVLHATTPQCHLNNRIIDVPTGSGWGGTTNIHAGLVMEPCYYGGGEEKDGRVEGGAGDFDSWPGRWRGGKVMKNAINDVLVALRENGALSAHNNGDDTLWCGNNKNNVRATTAYSNARLFMDVCSNGSTVSSSKPLDWDAKFHEPVTSSMNLNAKEKHHVCNTEGAKTSSKRVNYFSALVDPLLQKHPELESHITFLSGVQVERILVGYDNGCDEKVIVDGNQRVPAEKNGGAIICRGERDILCDNEHRARVWAVECLMPEGAAPSNNRRVLIRSRQEIVICAGAIGSPSLLLASGIGHEDDLKEAGIIPWYDQLPSSRYYTNQRVFRTLPVGHNLRDHLLLPRTFVTPRQRKDTMSCNSVHGWWLLDLPMGRNKSKNNDGNAKIQLQLADGIQLDGMIPHFAASAIQRRWSLPLASWEVPSRWIASIFYPLRYLLKAVFGHPFFRGWIQLHTASINVCLLNPQSVGKVTLVLQWSNVNKHHCSGARNAHRDETTSLPTRLSRCHVRIDPGYLSNPRDVSALWAGWNASTDIKRWMFGGCIEILPGFLLVALFFLVRVVSTVFDYLVSPVLGSVHAKKKEGYSESMPSWFSGYVAEFVNPYYHWCGTCAMGECDSDDKERDDENEAAFVVNEELCVQGIAGLRVCDASVFPGCISAPTALACAALGHAASSFVLKPT